MQISDWKPVRKLDKEGLFISRQIAHAVIQSVAAVGRKFLPESVADDHATLDWVPGLTRMAGRWVSANTTFRTSLSMDEFSIYLVDEKINAIGHFELEHKSQRQVLVWLEEQIGKLGLDATGLTLKLPYELPGYYQQHIDLFHKPDLLSELSRYFHNSYLALKTLSGELEYRTSNIHISPHHFDQTMSITIKDTGDPETNTTIVAGMSPGDDEFDQPYFYLSTWPYVDINAQKSLANRAFWHEHDWTGAVMLAENFAGKKNQQDIVLEFLNEGGQQLIKSLTA